jgi:phage terminase large subunit-like protein
LPPRCSPWTKAGTKDGDGACTAIVLMHKLKNGQFLIETVLRGRWGALERETVIKSAAEAARLSLSKHCWDFKVVIEQEPGSGGKESAEATIRNPAGFTAIAEKVTGSKEVRAEPLAAQVQGGNVSLVAGRWVSNFLDEAEGHGRGEHWTKLMQPPWRSLTSPWARLRSYLQWLSVICSTEHPIEGLSRCRTFKRYLFDAPASKQRHAKQAGRPKGGAEPFDALVEAIIEAAIASPRSVGPLMARLRSQSFPARTPRRWLVALCARTSPPPCFSCHSRIKAFSSCPIDDPGRRSRRQSAGGLNAV